MLDVLFAADRLLPPAGGAELNALELLGALADAGHNVRAASCDWGPASAPPGLDWTQVPQPDLGMTPWSWRMRVGRGRAVARAVTQAIGHRRPDLIATQLVAAPPTIEAARTAGIPSLLILHGYESLCHWRFATGSSCRPETGCARCPKTLALEPPERAARIAVARAHARSLEQATAIVAPSRFVAEATQAISARTAHVIAPIARGLAPVQPDRAGPLVCLSSYWTVDKGVEMLAPLARRLPDRTILVSAGDGGRHAPLPPLPGNVRVNLSWARTERLLEGAALVLVPSQFPEAWGRVAFEAMSAEVPVLVSDLGGLRDFVPATQRVSPHNDVDAWVSAIRRVLRPAAWAEARAAGSAAAAAVIGQRPLERLRHLAEQLAGGPNAASRPETAPALRVG